MLAASVASAFVGYIMGREALKVVTQPDIQSRERSTDNKPAGKYKGLELVSEREILIDVYNRTHGREQKKIEQQSQAVRSNKIVRHDSKPQTVANFTPVDSQSKGLTLMVSNARYEADSLLLELNLKNDSDRSVRFLYSFIDLIDDRNLPLSAIPEGLPSELPADGKNYRGKLEIPQTLLDNSKSVSLTLTDYPKREIELQLNNIPIVR